jgi:hypothetical protein
MQMIIHKVIACGLIQVSRAFSRNRRNTFSAGQRKTGKARPEAKQNANCIDFTHFTSSED